MLRRRSSQSLGASKQPCGSNLNQSEQQLKTGQVQQDKTDVKYGVKNKS
jgi:hypothetical protein